ncbi:hypothetical protein HG531_009239 [Fusarium graminearum]|nr:hypothetical protein HG531_009239 [Fusarium graminearum]
MQRRNFLVGDTLTGGLGGVVVANPLGGGNGVDLLDVHGVNLLESTVLGLDDEEEDNGDQGGTASGVDETVVWEINAKLIGINLQETDEEVEEPVGSSSNGHAARSVLGRVHLGDDSPDKRTPGGSESDNGQAGEGNKDGTSGGSVERVGAVKSEVTNKGVDKEAHHHPGGTNHQRDTATTLLNDVETAKGVLETGGSKDSGTEVEEEVDTSELLTSLESDAEEGTVHHTGTSEDLNPAGLRERSLLFKLLTDLINLAVNTGGVDVETSKVGDGLASFLLLTLAVGESGGLGEEEDANSEKKSPEEVETVGDPPRSAAVVVVGAPVDHLGTPDTEGDEELVAGDNDTSDDGRSTLGLVHGDSDREGTDTKTSDETTNSVLVPGVLGSDLNDGTDTGPESRDRDGSSTADGVAKVTGNERAEQASNREKTGDCSLSRRAELAHEAGQEGDATIGVGSLSPLEMLALSSMLLAFATKKLHIE